MRAVSNRIVPLRASIAAPSRAARRIRRQYQHLLRYAEAFNVQVAYTALSHGSYTIEERLARWLLMCHDRVDGDDLGFPPRSGGFCKEPEHPRRAEWHTDDPGD